MSEHDETNAKVGAWTEAAKLEFLLRIIAVYKDGKSMPWGRINMPGRTVKSLQNQWTKIQKDIAALPGVDAESLVKATPRKRGKKAADSGWDDDEQATPTKKKARTPAKAKGKVKKEEVNDDDAMDNLDVPIKKDEDSDMG